jgi:hypothetical protein
MLSLTLAALLGSTPLSIGILSLSSPDLPPKQVEALVDHLAVALEQERPITVVTSAQIAQVLGLERQRQLGGCEVQTECMAELSGALGVRFLLTGSAKRLGTEWLASLRLVDTSSGKAVDSGSVRTANEARLYDEAAALVRRFVKAARVLLGDVAAVPPQRAGWASWAPWVTAGVLAAGSAGCLIGSQTDAAALRRGALADAAAVQLTAARGQTLQTVGWGLGIAALAAGVTGLVFWLLGVGVTP